jgi:hypothetical protein
VHVSARSQLKTTIELSLAHFVSKIFNSGFKMTSSANIFWRYFRGAKNEMMRFSLGRTK